MDDTGGHSAGQQMIGSFITAMCSLMHHTSHVSVLVKHQITQVTQPCYSSDWLPVTSDFSQTKITFEREEVSDHQWDSGKYNGRAGDDWENCGRSQGAYFEGDWGVIVLCTMFLLSFIFFRNWLYFSYYMAGYLLDRPHKPFALKCLWLGKIRFH